VQEGTGTVTVTTLDPSTQATQSATANFSVTWPASAPGSPAVIPAGNPLTAIYRSPCPSGHMVRAQFAPIGTLPQNGMSTPYFSCTGANASFIIAGMRASTSYTIAPQDSQGTALGGAVTFTTGAIPAAVLPILPTLTPSGTSTAPESVFLESFIEPYIIPVAYDAGGNVIWYNYPPAPGGINQLMRSFTGGTLVLAQQNGLIQQIDLLGNILRETNISRVGEQLAAAPWNIGTPGVSRIADFNHDAFELSDGSIATLCIIEELADQGDGKGTVDVLGDAIVVLNQNWQVSWAWNGFSHLDITRKATLNDTCSSYEVGCPLLTLVSPGTEANDWMHANALTTTGDGNLLLSIRNQDWIVKIDYAGGTGNILWHFGVGGDFTATGDPSEPVLFPSHQHDASLAGTKLMLFDNANATFASLGGSRGEVWTINEAALSAQLVTDARMNQYSSVVGSARTLQNGNLYFEAGFIDGTYSQSIEFNSNAPYASPLVTFTSNAPSYRGFRMTDLYSPESP
jgi:arylsulfate sulfotransferase